ncbi:hypothetical protein R1sor_014215 [Riccia sorocarpa]|uniref:Uncharacterized protein n=1 Tax=Riccia sorocarpa TaxID=122646 RepID=A0ABD3HAL8_9MARC
MYASSKGADETPSSPSSSLKKHFLPAAQPASCTSVKSLAENTKSLKFAAPPEKVLPSIDGSSKDSGKFNRIAALARVTPAISNEENPVLLTTPGDTRENADVTVSGSKGTSGTTEDKPSNGGVASFSEIAHRWQDVNLSHQSGITADKLKEESWDNEVDEELPRPSFSSTPGTWKSHKVDESAAASGKPVMKVSPAWMDRLGTDTKGDVLLAKTNVEEPGPVSPMSSAAQGKSFDEPDVPSVLRQKCPSASFYDYSESGSDGDESSW